MKGTETKGQDIHRTESLVWGEKDLHRCIFTYIYFLHFIKKKVYWIGFECVIIRILPGKLYMFSIYFWMLTVFVLFCFEVDSIPGLEPNVGLALRTLRSRPELKARVRRVTDKATQAPLHSLIFNPGN